VRLDRGSAIGRVESAQFVGGSRKVGDGAGDRAQVVIEHLPVDVVDAVTSLVVAAIKDLARLPAPRRGLTCGLLFRVPVLRTGDRDARADKR
jgi:hypothetical protein